MKKRQLKRGDDIEVRFATQDGFIWHPSVIRHVNQDHIVVVFASGHSKMIDRRSEDYRLPEGKAYG